MVEIVAEAVATAAPSALQTYGPLGAIIILLGGPKGIAYLLSVWHAKKGGGKGKAPGRGICPLHAEFAAKLDERHTAVKEGMERIEDALTRLHERLDEALRRP